ncbi:MAG: Gfo/Idh/MocA family protein [Gemmataceae bacterium]
MAKLHWGILGVANIRKRLLPAFAKTKHAELKAIASRSLDRAKKAAAEADIPVAYGSYEQLLDDPDIEAVYIPLPNTLHGEWTRKAAERGKHILCEKPMTPTAAEARELVDFCKAKGVWLMEGFMWPHHPRTHMLRRFLEEGGIGAVERVAGAFTFKLDPFTVSNIRLQSHLAGGSLLDVGCYPVYGIRWAFGTEPVRVFATARYQHDVDVEMSGLLHFADGRMASFDCGFTLPTRGWLEITGTDGVVRVPEMWVPTDAATFEIHRDGHPTEVVSIAGEDQIAHMIDDFDDAILHGKPIHPPPEEAVKTLRVLDALAASARSGKEVEV